MIADLRDVEYASLAHQWTAQPTVFVLSGTTNRTSSALASGLYCLISTTACHFRQGGSTVNATTSDHYLPSGQLRYMAVDGNANNYVAGIQASAGGSLFLHPLMLSQP